jgi:hypothetical protein
MMDSCIGRGLRTRVRVLPQKYLGPGKHSDTPEERRAARQLGLKRFKPDQALIERYARPFLMGQTVAIEFEDILMFVRAEAVRRNIYMRRSARSRRQNRRAHHVRRKHLRALRRRGL